MKIPKYRIAYTPPGGSETNIENAYAIKVSFGIEAIKDTFSFTVIDSTNENNFLLNGTVKIYLYYEGGSETLVMDGLITDVSNKVGEKANKVTVKGNNRLEILLNHQVRADYTSSSASAILQLVIQAANDGQPSDRQITWYTGNSSTSKVVDYYSEYRPAFQHIEQLSSDSYTGDGTYIYYLEHDSNVFVWKARPTESVGSINYGEQTISLTRTDNPDDVVNFMIVNAGKDLNDSSIHTYAINPSSVGLLGWRTKYEIRNEYADFLKNVRPDLTDNSEFREVVKELARQNTERILDELSEGTDKVTLMVEGSTAWTAGELYQIKLPHSGWDDDNQIFLRLEEVEHNMTKKGWWTNLSLVEDVAI